MEDVPLIEYSEKVMDHFMHPRNVGAVADPDGVNLVGNPVCGDLMEVSIKMEKDVITDIKFKTASMVTELSKGRPSMRQRRSAGRMWSMYSMNCRRGRCTAQGDRGLPEEDRNWLTYRQLGRIRSRS